MEKYFLNSQRGKEYFQLPKAWQVVNQAKLKVEKTNKSISKLVSDSIANPIGTPALAELVKGKKKIVILVDDPARPTPKKAILTPLLDHLRQYGIRNSQITAIITLGTHRPMPEAEIEEVYGEKLSKDIKVINHNCYAEDLVSVGTLKNGGDLKINRLVAQADLRIAVGSVLPHPLAGFGGGAKSVLPGIAGYESIKNHHIALLLGKGVFMGNIENNPFRNEIREAGRLAKLDFIVNAVFDADEDVKNVVAGHFIEAHRVGVEICRKELGVRFNQPADVTLISAFPYTDGPQVLKPLAASNMVTKKGGVVILYASQIKGGQFEAPLLEAFDTAFAMAGGDPKRLVTDHIRDNKPIIPGIPMDFNSALNMTLLYVSRNRMILVSEDSDEIQSARLGFEYANSVQGAIDKIANDIPRATVNILPLGGIVLPLVPESMRTQWL
jgi:nickel-dependent lactate racemase